MDAAEDGSGQAEREPLHTSQPFPQGGKAWKAHGDAFQPYQTPPVNGQPQLDRKDSNAPPHRRRLIVDHPIVVKLTKEIVETYQICNPSFTFSGPFKSKRYLTNPSDPVSNGGLDNQNSDLILAVNSVLINKEANHQYIVKELLGQGTFGQVVKCWAENRDCFVAVKIIKNHPAYRQQAIVELQILNTLNGKYDPEDRHHIVRIYEHFVYQEHLCIVFEMLGVNLYELLKVNHFKGISLHLIRIFTKQILTALAVLRDASVIHCDLKPENILLTTRPESAELKLIDFGSACMEHRTVYSYIQSRFYRSPEVVLGHEYTSAIDMWSFGCVAAELFLGLPLFPAQSQYDLLQRMIKILGGGPPDHILRNAKNTGKYFKRSGAPTRYSDSRGEEPSSAFQFLTPEESKVRDGGEPTIGRHYFPEDWDLEQIIIKYHMKRGMTPEEIEGEKRKRFIFIDFIRGLVNFDPLKRWTPRQAAQHPFVTETPFMGPFQPPEEAPRMPVYQAMTVDHNPVSGHWFGAGLSPQVNPNVVFQFASPQHHGYPSYGSSFGSPGSHGSFGDGGVALGGSYGSYGDVLGSYPHRTPAAVQTAGFGISPDTWRRMGHMPPSAFGHTALGFSPSNSSFIPMSLGASPSNFTPPTHFQLSPGSPSTGSPSRYGPSGGGAAAMGKAAAFGQYKRRGWNSPGSSVNTNSGNRVSGHESSMMSWYGAYQHSYAGNSEASPSSYIDNTLQGSHLGSPRSSTHNPSQFRQRNGMTSGTNPVQGQNSKLVYPSGSLGALISKSQPATGGGDDTSPPPNPGDWDPNYSEDLLLETDGGDTGPKITSALSSTLGPGSGGPVMIPAPTTESSESVNQSIQNAPQMSAFRPGNLVPIYMESSPQLLHSYGMRPVYLGHASQQNSPSRLGQQQAQLLQMQHFQQQQQHHHQWLHNTLEQPQTLQHGPSHNLNAGFDTAWRNSYAGALEHSQGTHSHEQNFLPEKGLHRRAGSLSGQTPLNINEHNSGRRNGSLHGAFPPATRKDRRM